MAERVETVFPKFQVFVRIPLSVPNVHVEFWRPEFEAVQELRSFESQLGGKALEAHGVVRSITDQEVARMAELADMSVDEISKVDSRLIEAMKRLDLSQLAQLARSVRDGSPYQTAILEEVTTKVDRLQNLNKLFGKLAPAGTAPRTALEQLWDQSAKNSDDSDALLELRAMLESHWGNWTPAIRSAEGLPPVEPEQ